MKKKPLYWWVKMRGELHNDPDVHKIDSALLERQEFLDWFRTTILVHGDPTVPPVVVNTLAIRPRADLVNRITCDALRRVWFTVLNHATKTRNDAYLPVASAFMIDQAAGIPGLADAMLSVGWILTRADPEGTPSLCFPGLHEEAILPAQLKTANNTERQRKLRKRNAGVAPVSRSCRAPRHTNVAPLDEDEEREEEYRATPCTPSGGESSNPDAAGAGDETAAASSAARSELFSALVLPLADGTLWPVPADYLATLAPAYPGIDVPAQLVRARLHLDDQPAGKRPTVKTVKTFIRNWLGKARPAPAPPPSLSPPGPTQPGGSGIDPELLDMKRRAEAEQRARRRKPADAPTPSTIPAPEGDA